MKAESIALCNSLLDRHRERCIIGNEQRADCTITYGELCREAGVEHIVRSVGRFLQEVAEWSAAHKFPPLNSLAVNAETRQAG